MNKAIFIDKDGTLIKNVPYNVDPERIVLNEHVVETLAALQKHDYLLVVVANQAGVAKGYFKEKDLAIVNKRIASLLAANDVFIDAFFYCPHHPDGVITAYAKKCDCRKPAPGMLLQAAAALQIDLADSWMIGDTLDDVEAGHRAGCKSILYDAGGETDWLMDRYRQPDHKVTDLAKAAGIICGVDCYDKLGYTIAPEAL